MGCLISGDIYWWTAGGGFSFVDSGTPWGGGVGMSADGSALIAARRDRERTVPTVWYLDGSSIRLGSLEGSCDGKVTGSVGYDVSADGMVAVGQTETCTGQVGFAWSLRAGLEKLTPAAAGDSRGTAVSADGRVIVGFAEHPEKGFRRPALWQDGRGPEFILGSERAGEALGVSLDGRSVVGQADLGGPQPQAFYWTPRSEALGLGSLSGRATDCSLAKAVSDDGKVVGWCGDLLWGDLRAFLWTAQDGMVSLAAVLDEHDVDLPDGLILAQALDISGDGTTVVGVGRNRDWSEFYWRIRFEGPLTAASSPAPTPRVPLRRHMALPDSLHISPAEVLDAFPFGKRRSGRIP